MSNSPLVSYTKISPNKNVPRKNPIDRITPHCVVGQCSVETIGDIFKKPSRLASSNYGIGPDGRVGMYCEEKDRSWCSSSRSNDNRAITIECASSKISPYEMNNTVYLALIELCVDICRRNGKTKLLWLGDKNKTLSYKPAPDEMVITAHRWFSKTSCPGDWLYNRLGHLASEVTNKLNPITFRTNEEIATEVIYGYWGNGEERKIALTDAGYNYYAIQAIVNSRLAGISVANKTIKDIANEVILGKWGNGTERKRRLEEAGMDYKAVQSVVNTILKSAK